MAKAKSIPRSSRKVIRGLKSESSNLGALPPDRPLRKESRPDAAQGQQPAFEAILTRAQVEAFENAVMITPYGIARRVSQVMLTYDAAGLLAMIGRNVDETLEIMDDLMVAHRAYCKDALDRADTAYARFLTCVVYQDAAK